MSYICQECAHHCHGGNLCQLLEETGYHNVANCGCCQCMCKTCSRSKDQLEFPRSSYILVGKERWIEPKRKEGKPHA